MAQLYFRLQSRSSLRGGAELLRSQVHWLGSRDSCGCNPGCLLDHYATRIRLFENVLGGD